MEIQRDLKKEFQASPTQIGQELKLFFWEAPDRIKPVNKIRGIVGDRMASSFEQGCRTSLANLLGDSWGLDMWTRDIGHQLLSGWSPWKLSPTGNLIKPKQTTKSETNNKY